MVSTVTGGIFEADMCAIFYPISQTTDNLKAAVGAFSEYSIVPSILNPVKHGPHVWLEGLVTGSGSAVVGDINRLDWAGSSAACLHQD